MVKAVTYILGNNATVQGLLGNKAQTYTSTYYKVYPVVAPSSEKAPYIAVRLTGKVVVARSCDYNYTVTVACYHNSYDDVTALSDAVIAAIEGQASGTVNGMGFGFLNVTNEQDDYVKEHNLYAKVLTFEGTGD